MLSSKMIGTKIADARKKAAISQAQLAERLFISSQAVGKWERGESMPDILTFNRLTELLGVDLNYFSENFQSFSKETTTHTLIENSDEPSAKVMSKKKNSWDMSRGNWVDADFSGLTNLFEKFSGSNMQRCKFIGSDLSEIQLKGNNIDTCDFSGSTIHNSHIQRSHLVRNQFKECFLNETEFSGSYISGCDFTAADFTRVVFDSGGLEKSILTQSKWNGTSFKETYFADIVFDGVIEDCSFENCAFKRVTFEHATLTNTFFKNKTLKGIRFVVCQADRMTYEFLKNGKAYMTGVTLIS